MSTTITKVAIAGATGNLGPAILQELISAGFDVTVFTRQSSSHAFPSGVKVAKVDYDSAQSLTSALQGQDALVSVISHLATGIQAKLVDAAVAAGVKRIIPSDYGCDITLPQNKNFPGYAEKLDILKRIKEGISGTQTTWTSLNVGPFLDWGIAIGFLVNAREKKQILFDGGEVEWSTTILSSVGKAVAGILKHPAETTNRVMHVHSAVVTNKKLLELAQNVVGKDGWTITEVDTAAGEKASWEAFKADPANYEAWMMGFLSRAAFAAEHTPKFDPVDNELLGVPMISDKEIEDIIRKAVEV